MVVLWTGMNQKKDFSNKMATVQSENSLNVNNFYWHSSSSNDCFYIDD